MLCFVTVLAGVVAEADADAPLRDVLAAALEANERLARVAEELRAENARLREELARRDAELSGWPLSWRCCSGWCSGGRRSGRGRAGGPG